MGRGLSDLQRGILNLALDKRETGTSHDHRIDVFYADILVGVLGWKPLYAHIYPGVRNGYKFIGAKKFDPEAIGRKRYRAGMSALSRAVTRLEQRGLVTIYNGVSVKCTGIGLTDAGVTKAHELSVNSIRNCDSSQPIGVSDDLSSTLVTSQPLASPPEGGQA